MTNREAAYLCLRDHANQWVNGMDLIAAGAGTRYGGRIEELRKAGHTILSRRNEKSAVWDYMLVIPDVAPGQETLWAA